jgi:lysophospholipase L1-like esterase
LRDREYAPAKPPGTLRVAVIGDSLTMGSGVAIEQAYHSLLEQRLNDRAGAAPVEFINFGLSCYYLSQYVATLRHRALEWDPDLVLIGFYAGNDTRIPPLDRFARPYEVRPRRNGFWTMHSFSLLGDIWKYSILGKGRTRKAGKAPSSKKLAWVDEQFGTLADLAHSRGIPVLLAYLDNRGSEPGWIRELAENHGLVFVDATGRFEGTDINDYAIFLTDKHPNAEANRIFADELQPTLERLIAGVGSSP